MTQAVSETKIRIVSKKLPVDFQGSLPTGWRNRGGACRSGTFEIRTEEEQDL